MKQKTRWIHGIALQGWDRLGWSGRMVGIWMALRDRRGPLLAIVLASAYLLVVVEGLLLLAPDRPPRAGRGSLSLLDVMVIVCFASFVWRALWRLSFTTHEYGAAEGLRAVLRIPIANVIAILAGRRAIVAYIRTLLGEAVRWDKTDHSLHPAGIAGAGHRLAVQ